MGAPDTIFAKSYGDVISLLAQQEGSQILKHNALTIKRNVVGEETYMDQIASDDMEDVTGRLQTVTLNNPNYSRRRIAKYGFTKAYGLDTHDLLASVPDPTSPLVQNLMYAAGRKYDDRILTAARGTSYTGQEGGTSVALPAAQKVAAGGTGLTVAKLRSAKLIMDQGKVPFQDRFLALDALGMEDLLATTEVTSSDYNTVKALVQAQLDTFLGFKIIQLEAPVSSNATNTLGSSGASYAVAWHKTGLGLAVWADMGASIDKRIDLVGQPKQLSYNMSIGASRLEEAKIVEIAFV